MTRRPLTLLHTSDLHLGSDLYAAHAMAGYRSVLEIAEDRSVDALLVAGDLFDNRAVGGAFVGEILDGFSRLDRPVAILPGNHDTALLNGDFDARRAPARVKVLLERGGETVHFARLGLTVWGSPVYEHSPEFRPLAGVPSGPRKDWRVGLAHGLVTESDPYSEYSSKISPAELSAADCDYLALGHVHVFRDVTAEGGAPAFYSGAPSGGRRQTVALVSMDPAAGVSVERVDIRD